MSRKRKLNKARIVFLKGKNKIATSNNKIATLNISDECELEDKVREVEWIFEEVSGPSSKEKFDRKAYRASH